MLPGCHSVNHYTNHFLLLFCSPNYEADRNCWMQWSTDINILVTNCCPLSVQSTARTMPPQCRDSSSCLSTLHLKDKDIFNKDWLCLILQTSGAALRRYPTHWEAKSDKTTYSPAGGNAQSPICCIYLITHRAVRKIWICLMTWISHVDHTGPYSQKNLHSCYLRQSWFCAFFASYFIAAVSFSCRIKPQSGFFNLQLMHRLTFWKMRSVL